MEGSSGQEERAEGKEVVGRVRVQRCAKPGDTGDGDGTGDNEERTRGKGCSGWEKRGQRGTKLVWHLALPRFQGPLVSLRTWSPAAQLESLPPLLLFHIRRKSFAVLVKQVNPGGNPEGCCSRTTGILTVVIIHLRV